MAYPKPTDELRAGLTAPTRQRDRNLADWMVRLTPTDSRKAQSLAPDSSMGWHLDLLQAEQRRMACPKAATRDSQTDLGSWRAGSMAWPKPRDEPRAGWMALQTQKDHDLADWMVLLRLKDSRKASKLASHCMMDWHSALLQAELRRRGGPMAVRWAPQTHLGSCLAGSMGPTRRRDCSSAASLEHQSHWASCLAGWMALPRLRDSQRAWMWALG